MTKKAYTPKEVQLKIIPDYEMGSKRIYANFAAIDHTGFDVSIRFCDVAPPININSIENLPGTLDHKAPIVAEIVIPHNMLPGLIKALQDQHEKIQKKS